MTERLAHLTVAELVAVVGGIVATLALVVQAARKVLPWLRRVGHLIDDLIGEPARPGVPARPSLMGRVANVEDLAGMIRQQVLPNGGNSLRDEVDEIRRTLDEHLSNGDSPDPAP